MCPFVPTYDRAHELIGKSLIRFDPEQTQIGPIRQREKRHGCTFSAPGPSAVSLLILQNNLSSQGNVTLPCQLCLRLPPPPTVSLCIALSLSSPSSQISFGRRRIFPPLFSHPIMFHALLALLTSDATEQNLFKHLSPDPSRTKR